MVEVIIAFQARMAQDYNSKYLYEDMIEIINNDMDYGIDSDKIDDIED